MQMAAENQHRTRYFGRRVGDVMESATAASEAVLESLGYGYRVMLGLTGCPCSKLMVPTQLHD